MVYVNDTDLFRVPISSNPIMDEDGFPLNRAKDVQLRFFFDKEDPIVNQFAGQGNTMEMLTLGYTSTFGADLGLGNQFRQRPMRFLDGGGNRLSRVHSDPSGCTPYEPGIVPQDSVILISRGDCTFLEKLAHARHAKALGVIVINSDDIPINASADQDDLDQYGSDLDQAVLLVVSKSSGDQLLRMVAMAESRGFSEVLVAVEPEGQSGVTETRHTEENKRDKKEKKELPAQGDTGKILYVNGHPLMNTRLLV